MARFLKKFWGRLENRVFVIVLLTTLATSFAVYTVLYKNFYNTMLSAVRARTVIVNQYAQQVVPVESFSLLHIPEDKEKDVYRNVRQALNTVRQIAAVRYLYTAKLNAEGKPVYIIDGLGLDAEDFRQIGDPIEPEIEETLRRCLGGELITSRDILNTDWGAIFITCWPVRDTERKPVGAIVMEFDAQGMYDRIVALQLYSGLLSLGICVVFMVLSKMALNRVSEPFYKKLAYTDPLTDLPNRTAFEHDLEQHDLYRVAAGTYSVIVYDLNRLKQINDTLGHKAGDAYIQKMADVLNGPALRSLGLSYRIGGDEFASLVVGVPGEQVERLLNEAFNEVTRTTPDRDFFSFAYGIAHFEPDQDKSLRDTFRRADENMYAFKRECRLRAHFSPLPDTPTEN